ncbi:MAG: hypothetical protein Q8R96_13885 [Bacteroidota bacterium]|nr:hypothetical protein [Bacteroidota bacterium]
MKLEDLQVYQISMKLADEVHDLVMEWDNFHKFSELIDRYNSLGIKLNNYINTIGNSGNTNDH